ncbi:MAG TPA: VC0807 family protein [Acidimicrobiales bacterium]|nr:VC0807 family protein [Acidimicrobiales bacterium]
MPALLVATIIPLALFYIALTAGSVLWAIAVSVVYAYGVAAYQHFRYRRVSGMLLMTVFMATVRAVTAVVSGHPLVYFAIPVVETAAFGLMFVATMFSSEPLVVRLARDLVPGAADGLAARRSLIRWLSVVWTVTYLGSGTTTFVLLTTTPMKVFVGAHTLTGWLWTGTGTAVTVLICRARAAGLLSSAIAAAHEAAAAHKPAAADKPAAGRRPAPALAAP